MCAAGKDGYKEIVDSLLAKGADVQVKNQSNGNTALFMAASWGHKEIVSSLLAKGADVSIRCNEGDTALQKARKNGHMDVVKLIEQGHLRCEICDQLYDHLGYYTLYTAKSKMISYYTIRNASHSTYEYSDFRRHDYHFCGMCQLKWRIFPILLLIITVISGIIVLVLTESSGFKAFIFIFLLPLVWLINWLIRDYKMKNRLIEKALSDDGRERKVFTQSEYEGLKKKNRNIL